MTDEAISPLRRRMIEDMAIRKLTPKTQQGYIRNVKAFAVFLGRSPGTASREDVRRVQLHLTSGGAGTPKINGTVTALRFFFDVDARSPRHRKAPVVCVRAAQATGGLSPEEVVRFLEAAPGIKYKAALSVAYAAGLRVSELVSLKVSDIDSKRMLLRVEQGKGRKDRYAMLSPQLLKLLRDWYSRAASGAVLPRGVHTAGSDRRHRLPEQGRGLRPGRTFNDDKGTVLSGPDAAMLQAAVIAAELAEDGNDDRYKGYTRRARQRNRQCAGRYCN
jgi:integrase